MADTHAALPHERSEVNLRAIGVGVGTVAGGIAVALVAPWLFIAHGPAPANAPNDAVKPRLAAPVQETSPLAEIAAYRRGKMQRLESYGVDAATGEGHIPIERAMALVAAQSQRAGGGGGAR
jgi:hypothetical protein